MVKSVLRSLVPDVPGGARRFPAAAALAFGLAVALSLIGNPFARIDGGARDLYMTQPEAIGCLAGLAAVFWAVSVQRLGLSAKLGPFWPIAFVAGFGWIGGVALLATRGTLGVWLDPVWLLGGAALVSVAAVGWDQPAADANGRVLTGAAALVAALYLTYAAAHGLAALSTGGAPPPSITSYRPMAYAAMLLMGVALWLAWLARIDNNRETPLATVITDAAMRWGVLPCAAIAVLALNVSAAWPTLRSALGALWAGVTDVEYTLGRTGQANGDQLIYLSRAAGLVAQATLLHLLMRPFYERLGRFATPFRRLVLVLSLPLIVFLAIALYRRAGNHGWPVSVWQAMLIGATVLLIGLAAHIRPKHVDLRGAVGVIGLVMMLAAAGPWSPIGITARSARDTITMVAAQSGALENGRIKFSQLDLPNYCEGGGDSLGARRMLCNQAIDRSLEILAGFQGFDLLRPLFTGQPWDPFADPQWHDLDSRAKRGRLSRHLGTCQIFGAPPSGPRLRPNAPQLQLPPCE